MKLSLYLNKIAIDLEKNENFIKLQDSTYYNLCYEFQNGHYLVPYVSLPILMHIAKKVGYRIALSDTLKKYYSEKTGKRQILERVKTLQSLQEPNLDISPKVSEAIQDIQKLHSYSLINGQDVSAAFVMMGKRVIIANDIGTGKTITVNTAAKSLIRLGEVKKVLVMLPAALVKNYYNDYVKFFGKQGVIYIKKYLNKDKRKEEYRKFISNPNVNFLIVNYDKCNFDYEELKSLKVDMLIVDEFHNMKNFLFAKRSIQFFDLVIKYWKPEYRVPMSGTPIENQLFDLFPVFKLIDGGHILGGMKFFQENFVEYKDVYMKLYSKRTGDYFTKVERKAVGFKNEDYLHKLIKPLIIRKKLKLPVNKYPQDILIDPTKEMLEKYEEIKLLNKTNPSKAYHEARQFLCDTNRNGYKDNPKIEEMENIISQTDEKFVIFSFYKCTIFMLEEYFKNRGDKTLSIHGDESRDALDTIKEFEKSDARFLLCTDKVNFGQNIQFCRYMIQWEKPLKPTTEEQREGRLYRTGQQNDVHIYSFVVSDTVEERIYDMFNAKKDIIKNVIETLNDKELKKIEAEIEKEVMKEFS